MIRSGGGGAPFQRLGAVRGLVHLEAVGRQQHLQQVAVFLLVVDMRSESWRSLRVAFLAGR